MGLRTIRVVGIVAPLLLFGQTTWAGLPFPQFTDFENDTDTYVPDGHPLDNPQNIYGAPPQLGTYSGTYGITSAGWFDKRNSGFNNLLEEVPSGYQGVTSSRGANHGVMWPGLAEGEAGSNGRPAKQDDNVVDAGRYLGGGDNLGGPARWSFQMDFYLDPTVTYGLRPANQQVPQIKWDGFIGSSANGQFVTQSYIGAHHRPNGTYELVAPTGNLIAAATDGQWVTLEVRFDFSGTKLGAIHSVWNQDHTALLGRYTGTSDPYYSIPNSAAVQGGPRAIWFEFENTYYHPYDHLSIDHVGVGIPIQLVLRGDMDGSGVVNNFDITPFELALTNSAAYLNQYPDLTDYPVRGNVNQDGAFNNFDIASFEQLLTGSGAAAVPEPSTFVLLAVGMVALFHARAFHFVVRVAPLSWR